MEKLRLDWSLTKPRVMLANALTAAAGFLLASGWLDKFDLWLFIALFTGSSLVIASACVINNYLDRDIDSKMERTKKRATVTGEVGKIGAVTLSAVLGITGLVVSALWVNWLVVFILMFGFIVYVWLYGALAKRRSVHGTLVGSVSGAVPILAGYCAVTGMIDTGAVLLFLSLFFWQMPEFYSIAIYRRKEYAAAGVPVITVVKGIRNTKFQIFTYTLLFVLSSVVLGVAGYAGIIYLLVMLLLGLYWLWLAGVGLKTPPKEDDAWARRMFHFSMLIILAYCAMLAVGPLLP
jgi:protoheme IX farnesyltransferase